MTTTYVAAIIVVLSVLAGLKKGLVAAILDMVSVMVSYTAVVFLTRPIGALLVERRVLPGLTGYLAAPLFIVFGVAIVFGVLRLVLLRRRRPPDEPYVPKFRIAGAMVNGLAGCFYATLVVWAIMFYQGIVKAQPTPPTLVEHMSGRFVSSLGSTVVHYTLPTAPVLEPATQKLLSDPGQGMKSARTLVSNQRLTEILQDTDFQRVLDAGDVARVVADRRFRQLLDDPEFGAATEDLGLAQSGEARAQFEEYYARTLVTVWQRMSVLESDPEIQALIEEPTFKAALESRDLPELLRHPNTGKLLEAVWSSGGAAAPPRARP